LKKDILGIKDLPKEELLEILNLASAEKPKIQNKNFRDNSLKNTSVTTLFYENSTRTKISFLLASGYLGAITDDLNISTSSVSKGETLIDTGTRLDVMGTNIIVLRHSMTGSSHLLAKNVKASVINGGDGINEHPTQAMLDIFTIKEQKNNIKDLKIVISGDVSNSRVARSNIFGLSKLGANIVVCGSSTLISPHFQSLGVYITTNIKEAVKDADVVMALRIQKERQNTATFPSTSEYAKFFGINDEVLSYAKKDVLVMHPGPINRGVELSAKIIDSEKSLIDTQVENGIAVRMAVLKYLSN